MSLKRWFGHVGGFYGGIDAGLAGLLPGAHKVGTTIPSLLLSYNAPSLPNSFLEYPGAIANSVVSDVGQIASQSISNIGASADRAVRESINSALSSPTLVAAGIVAALLLTRS